MKQQCQTSCSFTASLTKENASSRWRWSLTLSLGEMSGVFTCMYNSFKSSFCLFTSKCKNIFREEDQGKDPSSRTPVAAFLATYMSDNIWKYLEKEQNTLDKNRPSQTWCATSWDKRGQDCMCHVFVPEVIDLAVIHCYSSSITSISSVQLYTSGCESVWSMNSH